MTLSKFIALLVLCQLCRRATSQPCLYNYTVGDSSPVFITQSAPVCLICANTTFNEWHIVNTPEGDTYPPGIPSAPYILYVTSPVTTLITNDTETGVKVTCYTTGAGYSYQMTFFAVYIAAPVVPQVVTYVNETDTLNLACSSVITVSPVLLTHGAIDQSWLDPHGNTISASSNISLPSISRTAAGNYTCVKVPNWNNETNVTASTLVVVYYPPNITSPQLSVFKPQGLSVQLNCSFDGLPVPTITWTLPSGSVLTSSQGRFMLQSTSTFTSLTISSLVGGGDSGTYTCTASNLRGVASSSVQLTVQANGLCNSELNVTSDRGTYNWPEAEPNHIDSQLCQYGVMIGQNITRYCNTNLTWTEDSSKCPTVVTNQFAQLNNLTVTTQNVVNVTAQLQSVVSQATQVVDQSASNLAVVAAVFTKISNISSTAPVQNDTIMNVVSVLSSIQTWPPMVLSTSGSIIVQIFETIATSFVQQDNFTKLDVTETQTRFLAEKILLETLIGVGESFTTDSNMQSPANSSNLSTALNAPVLAASVLLPGSLFKTLAANINSVANIGIFFSIYNTTSLLPLASAPNSTTVAPLVVGVTVIGINTSVLMYPIQLNFSISNNNNDSSYNCVSWDFKAAGNKGNWTSDGCITTQVNASNTASIQIICRCFHLTNFAVLVDISSRINSNPSKSLIPPIANDAITYIGVSLSLFGLVATVISLLLIKKLREKDISKYHIQLCCALIGMLLVFVTGIDKTGNFGGCVTVSVLIHYFTLVAVMWMGAEALFMFQKIVIVFFQITTHYIVTLSLICWMVPMVPVIIPLGIDRNLLVKQMDVNDSTMGYCFISNVGVFFGAFLGPILLVLAFNVIIFIIVIVVLLRHLRKRSNEKAGSLKLMANITGIAFLFGLTWLFGALTVVNFNQAFQILFSLANSFQGFLIFIFFCVLNSDVRLAWAQKILGKHLAPQMSAGTTSAVTKQTIPYQTRQDAYKQSEYIATEDISCVELVGLEGKPSEFEVQVSVVSFRTPDTKETAHGRSGDSEG